MSHAAVAPHFAQSNEFAGAPAPAPAPTFGPPLLWRVRGVGVTAISTISLVPFCEATAARRDS
jgi:hypothetical protein